MTWVQFIIGVGYLLVLLAAMALLHGATLVLKDLHRRRQEERQPQKTEAGSDSVERIA